MVPYRFVWTSCGHKSGVMFEVGFVRVIAEIVAGSELLWRSEVVLSLIFVGTASLLHLRLRRLKVRVSLPLVIVLA